MANPTPALRGLGRGYRPTYRDPATRQQKTAAVWWIEFWRDGHQHRESSKSRKAADARKLLKPRLGEVAKGQFVGRDVARTTFGDLRQQLDTVLNPLTKARSGRPLEN